MDFCSPKDFKLANGFDSGGFILAKGFAVVVVVVVVVVFAGVVVVVVVIFANGFEDTDEPKENDELGKDGAVVLIEPKSPPELDGGGFGALIPPFMPF